MPLFVKYSIISAASSHLRDHIRHVSVGHCGTQCGSVWDSVGQCGTPPANTLGQQQEKLESELEFVETLLKFVQNRLEFEQTHSMHQISWLRQQRGKYYN